MVTPVGGTGEVTGLCCFPVIFFGLVFSASSNSSISKTFADFFRTYVKKKIEFFNQTCHI
jgi:hypothetical protein